MDDIEVEYTKLKQEYKHFRSVIVAALAGKATEEDVIALLDDIEKHRLRTMRRAVE